MEHLVPGQSVAARLGDRGEGAFRQDLSELVVIKSGTLLDRISARIWYTSGQDFARRHVDLARSETFEALFTGMQRAFQSFGGVPLEVQTDRLSAATHQLKDEDKFGLTESYQRFLVRG